MMLLLNDWIRCLLSRPWSMQYVVSDYFDGCSFSILLASLWNADSRPTRALWCCVAGHNCVRKCLSPACSLSRLCMLVQGNWDITGNLWAGRWPPPQQWNIILPAPPVVPTASLAVNKLRYIWQQAIPLISFQMCSMPQSLKDWGECLCCATRGTLPHFSGGPT